MKSRPTRHFDSSPRDDHEMQMTSPVIVLNPCSNMLRKLKVDLTRKDAVERVTRIELA